MFKRHSRLAVATSFGLMASLGIADAASNNFTVEGTAGSSLRVELITTFDEPWAMAFAPTGDLLVT
ncbi:MAG: PQQ-dependent sugar dehydrogenase, partial [Rhizobiales bacterium]|nr:PQQ-dependent sugar dehydrogenase [Hyphomicrobiales bacterium]